MYRLKMTLALHPIESCVLHRIQSGELIHTNDRLLLGVSGGVDSVALFWILQTIREKISFQMIVGHLNHGWRGRESANDARFVQALCRRSKIPCIVEKMNSTFPSGKKSGGREAEARVARYDFFHRTAREHACRVVAVAHHRDDRVETLLINLLRGSGPAGLTGIGAESTINGLKIIRPMIDLSRTEIERYCQQRKLKWREDASNRNINLLRNRIRGELLPLLEQDYNPKVREALDRLGRILDEENRWADDHALQAYNRIRRPDPNSPPEKITLSFISSQPVALVRRCLRLWLTELRPSPYPPPLQAVDELIRFTREVAPGGLCHSIDSLVFKKTRQHIQIISREPGKRIRKVK